MMSLLLFWALNVVVHLLSMQGQKALRFHQKYLNLCSKDERRSYRFGTTWGWVMTEFWQFWVNYPFMVIFLSALGLKSKSSTSKYSVVSSLTPMTRTPLNSCHWHWHQNLHILRAFVEILQIYNMVLILTCFGPWEVSIHLYCMEIRRIRVIFIFVWTITLMSFDSIFGILPLILVEGMSCK